MEEEETRMWEWMIEKIVHIVCESPTSSFRFLNRSCPSISKYQNLPRYTFPLPSSSHGRRLRLHLDSLNDQRQLIPLTLPPFDQRPSDDRSTLCDFLPWWGCEAAWAEKSEKDTFHPVRGDGGQYVRYGWRKEEEEEGGRRKGRRPK